MAGKFKVGDAVVVHVGGGSEIRWWHGRRGVIRKLLADPEYPYRVGFGRGVPVVHATDCELKRVRAKKRGK